MATAAVSTNGHSQLLATDISYIFTDLRWEIVHLDIPSYQRNWQWRMSDSKNKENGHILVGRWVWQISLQLQLHFACIDRLLRIYLQRWGKGAGNEHCLLSNGWRTFTINILQWWGERSFFFRAAISIFNKCLRSVDHVWNNNLSSNRICHFTFGTLKHSTFLEKMVTKYPFQLTVGSKLKNSRSP